MTHWYVWHDSSICVTWLIDMCDMTRCCLSWSMLHLLTYVADINMPRHTYEWIISHVQKRHMSWQKSHMSWKESYVLCTCAKESNVLGRVICPLLCDSAAVFLQHKYEWIISHVQKSANDSCVLTYVAEIPRLLCMSRHTAACLKIWQFLCDIWLIRMPYDTEIPRHV